MYFFRRSCGIGSKPDAFGITVYSTEMHQTTILTTASDITTNDMMAKSLQNCQQVLRVMPQKMSALT